MKAELLGPVYQSLAEVFAHRSPNSRYPDWLSSAGPQWPCYAPLLQLHEEIHGSGVDAALRAIQNVPASSSEAHHEQYQALFVGCGHPPIWLHESVYRDGRLFGPTSLAVKKIYQQAGLQISGSELADHASLEFAFLAFLAAGEVTDPLHSTHWKQVRRLFVQHHAGQWLPQVGQQLAASPFTAWAAIGMLVMGLLTPAIADRSAPKKGRSWPELGAEPPCSLCGFCVQVCPTQALSIYETQNTTALHLAVDRCSGCTRCERICHTGVLQMGSSRSPEKTTLLFQSARAKCAACGKATVSESERDSVAEQIGSPEWLDYCLECRTLLLFETGP